MLCLHSYRFWIILYGENHDLLLYKIQTKQNHKFIFLIFSSAFTICKSRFAHAQWTWYSLGTKCMQSAQMHAECWAYISLDRQFFLRFFFALLYVCCMNNICIPRSPLSYTQLTVTWTRWMLMIIYGFFAFYSYIFSCLLVCMISTMAVFNNTQPSTELVFSWSWRLSQKLLRNDTWNIRALGSSLMPRDPIMPNEKSLKFGISYCLNHKRAPTVWTVQIIF